MKIQSSSSTFSFDEITDLLVKKAAASLLLDHAVGGGSVEMYTLTPGLQVRFWNCDLKEQVELFGNEQGVQHPAYFTLAFFLNTDGFRFANKTASLSEHIKWDTIFISDRSHCKIVIAPGRKVQCLSISFSKKWFRDNVLKKTAAFEK